MLREINSSEFVIIQQLAHEIWPIAYQSILSKEQLSYMLDSMYNSKTLSDQLENGQRCAVYEIDNNPIGFVCFEANYPTIGTMRIHKLYVLSHLQGGGYGKKLIKFVTHEAKLIGLTSINLNVNRFNTAVKFYKYLGFKIIREEDIDIGNGYLMEDYFMELGI